MIESACDLLYGSDTLDLLGLVKYHQLAVDLCSGTVLAVELKAFSAR